MKLNLETKTKEQELIKQYLEENASQTLADKINNGVPAEKDGKPLISRKNLDGFFSFASEEARKLVDSGARSACVEDKTVYSWAIHYFEEDSILGTLYYMDGAEYKPAPKAKTTTAKPIAPIVTKKEEKPQMSFFDLGMSILDDKKPDEPIQKEEQDDELDNAIQGKAVTEDGEIIDYEEFDGDVEEEVKEEQTSRFNPVGTPLYQKYMNIQKQYPSAILAIKLGDFYEFLGDNAVTVANELDLTLTGRDCGLENRVPMCGIPYHAVDNYFNKITLKHDLAVIEDMQDIRLIKKRDATAEKPKKAFNLEALCVLDELFGNDLEVQ